MIFFNTLPDIKQPWASQAALVVKKPPTNAGDVRDVGSIPGLGRSPGVEMKRDLFSTKALY